MVVNQSRFTVVRVQTFQLKGSSSSQTSGQLSAKSIPEPTSHSGNQGNPTQTREKRREGLPWLVGSAIFLWAVVDELHKTRTPIRSIAPWPAPGQKPMESKASKSARPGLFSAPKVAQGSRLARKKGSLTIFKTWIVRTCCLPLKYSSSKSTYWAAFRSPAKSLTCNPPLNTV